jgi:23S rRNA pseudoU1915 N3-methylase RlmH
MKKKSTIKTLSGERWKELELAKGTSRKRYAISSLGRLVSFHEKIEDGYVLRHGRTQGYPSVSIGRIGKRQNFYIHRLVAEYFVRRANDNFSFVIHVDHKKDNNKASNLKWVKQEEQIKHAMKDPNVIARLNSDEGKKLNIDKVKQIKILLFKSKKQPTLKALAKKFKVSDMQIHRIKTGENWSRVKV